MDSSLGSQNSRQSTSHCRNFDDVAGLKVSSRLSLLFIAEGRLLNETQQLLIPHKRVPRLVMPGTSGRSPNKLKDVVKRGPVEYRRDMCRKTLPLLTSL